MRRFPHSKSDQSSAPVRLLPSNTSKSRAALLIGVLLIAGSSLAFVLTALHLDSRPSVLVVRNNITAGDLVRSQDLGVVRVSSDSALRPIAASDLSKTVGRPAAVSLVPGTLLTDAQLGKAVELQLSQALVGVSVKSGQFPPGLKPGARVQVVQTATDGTGEVIADNAVVADVIASASNDISAVTVVSLKVSVGSSTSVAAASASGHVSLVQEPVQ